MIVGGVERQEEVPGDNFQLCNKIRFLFFIDNSTTRFLQFYNRLLMYSLCHCFVTGGTLDLYILETFQSLSWGFDYFVCTKWTMTALTSGARECKKLNRKCAVQPVMGCEMWMESVARCNPSTLSTQSEHNCDAAHSTLFTSSNTFYSNCALSIFLGQVFVAGNLRSPPDAVGLDCIEPV